MIPAADLSPVRSLAGIWFLLLLFGFAPDLRAASDEPFFKELVAELNLAAEQCEKKLSVRAGPGQAGLKVLFASAPARLESLTTAEDRQREIQAIRDDADRLIGVGGAAAGASREICLSEFQTRVEQIQDKLVELNDHDEEIYRARFRPLVEAKRAHLESLARGEQAPAGSLAALRKEIEVEVQRLFTRFMLDSQGRTTAIATRLANQAVVREVFNNDLRHRIDFEGRLEYAQDLIRQKLYPEANDVLQELHKETPRHTGVLESLAILHFRIANFGECRGYVNKTLALLPNDPTARKVDRALKARGF